MSEEEHQFEPVPEEKLVVACVMAAPDGTEFLAFVDREGKIRTEDEATMFLLEVRLYTSLPLAIGYREGGAGRWVQRGDGSFPQILGETPPDQVILGPVLLRRPKPPDS